MTDAHTARELATYLVCPRKYELEHATELSGDHRHNGDQFRQLLRRTICTGYVEARSGNADPHAAAVETLDAEWPVYADAADHHSSRQVATEKNRARAGIDAYFEAVGSTHLEGIERAQSHRDSRMVGPGVRLTATIEGHRVAVDVDYVTTVGERPVAVRLSDTMWGSRVPYENKDEIAEKHLEQGEYHPEQVGTVIAGRIAEAALQDDGEDERGAELLYLSVMENTFEIDGECEAEIERRWMGPFLSDSRGAIDSAIAWIAENIDSGAYNPEDVFDGQGHWEGSFEQVLERSCQYCPYAAGCQDLVGREVRFDV